MHDGHIIVDGCDKCPCTVCVHCCRRGRLCKTWQTWTRGVTNVKDHNNSEAVGIQQCCGWLSKVSACVYACAHDQIQTPCEGESDIGAYMSYVDDRDHE